MIEQKISQLLNTPETFIGEAPTGKDNCQWIRAGAGSTKVHFAKGNYDKPSFSIYVRGVENEETCERTNLLFNRIRNYTDAGCEIIATRLPQFVGKDDKHRSVYVFQIEYQSGRY